MIKLKKWEIIYIIVLSALTIISIILNSFLDIFKIVTVCFFAIIMVSIALNRIAYTFDKKKEFDKRINVYFLELLNTGLITKEQFNTKDEALIRGYYKPYRDLRKKQIIIICIVVAVTLSLTGFYIGII